MTLIVTQEKVSGTHIELSVPYHIYDDTGGTIDIDEGQLAASTQFATDFGELPTDQAYQQLAKHSMRVVCKLKPQKLQRLSIPGKGTATWRFSYQDQGEYMERSLSTIAKYPSTAPSFDNLLNVRASDLDFDGYNVPAGTVTDAVELIVPWGEFTQSYRNTIMALRGHVNSTTFLNRPAGSVRIIGATSQKRTDEDLALNLRFEYKPPVTGLSVITSSGTQIISHDGHDYLWTFKTREVEDGDANTIPHIRPVVHYAYVERLFPRSNLNALLVIPGV